MFSKGYEPKLVKVFAAIIVSVSCLMACHVPINESQPPLPEIDQKLGEGTQCLAKVLPVMKEFMAGDSRLPQVEAMWDCFSDAIELFRTATRGRNSDFQFSPRELANFFETYYLDGTKISNTLLGQIFQLKQLVLGGSVDYLTRDEMGKLISFSQSMKGFSRIIHPYMKLYSQNWNIRAGEYLGDDLEYFAGANKAIQEVVKGIAQIIETNGVGYSLANLPIVIGELERMYGAQWDFLEKLNKIMPLVYKLKYSLTGGDPKFVSANEWRRFSLLSSRGFIQFLRYYYFIDKNKTFGAGPEIAYIFSSIDDLFSYLGDMVGGKPGARFTDEELLDVLTSVGDIVGKIHPDMDFIREIMKIKVMIFGGSATDWKQQDFENARTKVDAFRELTQRFLKYSNVYGISWKPDLASLEKEKQYFSDADKNLTEFSDKLSSVVENQYDLKDFVSLCAAFDRFYPPSGDRTSKKDFAEKYLSTLVAAKNILTGAPGKVHVGPDGNPIIVPDTIIGDSNNPWSKIFSFVGRGFGRYLYYYYFVKDQAITGGVGLEGFNALISDSLGFVTLVIKSYPNQQIPWAQFDMLLGAMREKDFIPSKVKLTTYSKLLRVLGQKLLQTPEDRIAGTVPEGLSEKALRVIGFEVSLWSDGQRLFDQLYNGLAATDGLTPKYISDQIGGIEPTVGRIELRSMFQSAYPLAYNGEGKVILGDTSLKHIRASANQTNLAKAGVRLVMNSYIGSLERLNWGALVTPTMNIEETKAFFNDIKPLVEELGLIDPKNITFAESRFRDANLFTPQGNGDQWMDFKEGSDLIMLIFSGLEVHSGTLEKIEKDCAIDPSEIPSGRKVFLNCAWGVYQKNLSAAFSGMPAFVAYASRLDVKQFATFMESLTMAAGYVPDGSGKIKLGDLSLTPHITQYVEGVFQKYDIVRDGVWNTTEGMSALPVYRETIVRVGKGSLKNEKMVRGFFSWFLKYQNIPETLGQKIKFYFWHNKSESKWDLRVDRDILGRVFGFIGKALASPAFMPMSLDLSEEERAEIMQMMSVPRANWPWDFDLSDAEIFELNQGLLGPVRSQI